MAQTTPGKQGKYEGRKQVYNYRSTRVHGVHMHAQLACLAIGRSILA